MTRILSLLRELLPEDPDVLSVYAAAEAVARERVRLSRQEISVDRALVERIASRGHYLRPARRKTA